MSDNKVGGRNSKAATWCKNLPEVTYPSSGHPPGLRFPAWTFDRKRGKATLYAGPGSLYQYDAKTNRWTLTVVTGGPTLATYKAGQSLAYADDPEDTYVWVSEEQLWQLPGKAISRPDASSCRRR